MSAGTGELQGGIDDGPEDEPAGHPEAAGGGGAGDRGVRDLGEQPLAGLLAERGLTAGDLVTASDEGLTFKQVGRACRGRRLTPRMRAKVLRAAAAATGEELAMEQLFTYR